MARCWQRYRLYRQATTCMCIRLGSRQPLSHRCRKTTHPILCLRISWTSSPRCLPTTRITEVANDRLLVDEPYGRPDISSGGLGNRTVCYKSAAAQVSDFGYAHIGPRSYWNCRRQCFLYKQNSGLGSISVYLHRIQWHLGCRRLRDSKNTHYDIACCAALVHIDCTVGRITVVGS